MSKLKILTVDDSMTMRRILTNTLKRAGYSEVMEATDGKDALAKIMVEVPDLVITDWNMPQMDGLEFVTTLRASDKYKDLPILMVSTRSVKEDIVEAMQAGVNNYIVKPFTVELLQSKIDKIFG